MWSFDTGVALVNASLQHGPTNQFGARKWDLSPDVSGRKPGSSGAQDEDQDEQDKSQSRRHADESATKVLRVTRVTRRIAKDGL